MNIIEAVSSVLFKNYVNFSGRARRSEFWYYNLSLWIIYIALYIIFMQVVNDLSDWKSAIYIVLLYLFIYLFTFLPSLAVSVRRLHDVNRTGKWILLTFVPIINLLVIFLLLIWIYHMELMVQTTTVMIPKRCNLLF